MKKNYFKKNRIKCSSNSKTCVKNANKKCEICNKTNGVSAHHIIFRSEYRDDSLDNLIALCFDCHRKAHDGFWEKNKEKVLYVTARDFMIYWLDRRNNKLHEKVLLLLKKKENGNEI